MTSRHFFAQFVVLLILAIPTTLHSTPDINMGALNPYLSTGSQGVWNIRAADDSVLLENTAGGGEITYFYVNPKPEEEGRREISVKVELQKFGSNSWAGLLYGFKENPKSYYIFALQGENTVSLFHRTDRGFKQRLSQQFSELSKGMTHLTIREQGNTISLIVNGREISSFGNDSIGKGAVGIAAADIGTYRFNGFQINKVLSDTTSNEPAITPPDTTKEDKAKIPDDTSTSSVEDPKTQILDNFDPILGMVSFRMVIPADWKKQSDSKVEKNGLKAIFKSSDGVTIYEEQLRVTAFPSGDPQLDILSQQRGMMVEQYQPLEQIVQQALFPIAKKLGAKLIRSYKVPEILNFHRQEILDDPWHTKHFDSFATEWDMGDGRRALNLAAQFIAKPTRRSLNNSFSGKALIGNTIMFRNIDAPEAEFEKARDAYIASIANIEINAVWKNINYQKHLTKMAQIESKGKADIDESWQRHKVKMNNLNTQAAAQKQIGDTYSDILDISHSGYLSQSKIKYQGHKSSIRGINERTIISNGNAGSNFSVQAGSKHYWVNRATGKYFGTDNALLDPRSNNRFKGQWERFNEM